MQNEGENSMAKSKGTPENLDPVRTKEEARRRGHNGGVKSGETRRAQRDAKQAALRLLNMAAKGKMRENLLELGYNPKDEEGIKNVDVLVARLLVLAAAGNLQATDKLIKIAGWDAEENRAERESLNADRRREIELEAKVAALANNPDATASALNMNDEDGRNDVVIYMPQIASEESCEMEEEEDSKEYPEGSEMSEAE